MHINVRQILGYETKNILTRSKTEKGRLSSKNIITQSKFEQNLSFFR